MRAQRSTERCNRLVTVATVCVLAYAAALVSALTILATEDPLNQVRGITTMTTNVYGRLTAGDFQTEHVLQIQSGDGTIDTVIISSEGSEYPHAAYYEGVIAADGRRVVSRVFPVRDLEVFRNINATRPGVPYLDPEDQPGGRRLLEFQVTNANADGGTDAGRWGKFPDDQFVTVMCANAAIHGQNPSNFAICSSGPSQGDFEAVVASQNQTILALKNFADKLNKAENQTVVAEGILGQERHRIQDWQNTTRNAINDIQRDINITSDKEIQVAGVLQAEVNALGGQTETLATRSLEIAQEVAGIVANTSNEIDDLHLESVQSYARYSDNLLDLSRNVARDHAAMNRMIRATQLTFLDLLTAFGRYKRGDDMLREQNKQLQAAISAYEGFPNERGATMRLYSIDPGRPPATNPDNLGPLFNHITIADDIVRGIFMSGGLPNAAMTRMRYDCESRFLVHTAPVSPTWRDLFDWIGPPGCNAVWSAAPYCKCSMQIEESRCVLRNTAGTVDSDALQQWVSQTSVAIGTATGCIAQGVPFPASSGGLDHATVTSYTELAQIFQTIGLRGSYQSQPYTFSSIIRDASSVVDYADAMRNSTNFMSLAMPRDVATSKNLVFWYLQGLAASYEISDDHEDAYRELVDGRLPTTVHQKPLVYSRAYDGQVLTRGSEFTIVFFSEERLIVTKLVPGQVTANIEVEINGEATPVSTLRINDPKQSLLHASRYIVWDPATAPQRTWNAPDEETEVSPFPGERAHRLVYPIASSAARFAPDYHEVDNGREFNPDWAGNFAAMYETPLDDDPLSPTYGHCIGDAVVGGGQQCLIRQHYDIQALGSFGTPGVVGTFLYRCKTCTMDFQFAVPKGPIREMVESACPKRGIVTYSGLQILVPLTNLLPSDNDVRIEQLGQCASTSTLTIPAGRTRVVTAQECAVASASQPDILRVSYLLGGQYYPCTGIVNLTHPLNGDGGGITGGTDSIASYGFTLQLNAYAVDSTLVALAREEDTMNANSGRLLNLTLTSRLSTGFKVPDDYFDSMRDSSAYLDDLAANATQDAIDTRAIVTNASSAITYAYDQEFAESSQRTADALATVRSNAQQINDTNRATQVAIVDLKRYVVLFKQTPAAVVSASIQMGIALDDAIAKAVLPNNSTRWAKGRNLEDENGFWEAANALCYVGDLDVVAIDDGVKTADKAEKIIDGVVGDLTSKSIFSVLIMLVVFGVIGFVLIKAAPSILTSVSESTKQKVTRGDNTIVDELQRRYNALPASSALD